MSVTIKDVARLAGVSPSTVSRVLANHPKISQETARRVREAMERLGYVPNAAAKSLVSQTTQTLGIILPRAAEELFVNPFFPEVLRGISVQAQQAGYDLLLASGSTDREEREAVARLVLGRRVDGVLLLCSRSGDPVIRFLREQRFPFVLIGRAEDDEGSGEIVSVDTDNVRAAYDATRHLLEKGHRCIAFISGPQTFVVRQDRLAGYRAALAEADIPVRPEWVIEAPFLQEGGYLALDRLLHMPERPTALVVTDDIIAIGILRRLYQYGWRVPDDLALVSFNNVALAELTTPPLTTVDIDIYRLGTTAISLLLRRITGEVLPSPRVIVPHRLIVRESCKSTTLRRH
ncbi:MAG: LacI family transcriptional regulator [Calditerricola sp.]|nr:LacI family transcriptional regulator [Calditerricola sp.]